MTGLDASGRTSLERLVGRGRRILEEDLAASAQGRFGIHRNGDVENVGSLRLTASELIDRRDTAAIVRHLRSDGESASGAVDRLIREASFTHLNRLVAIRIAESLDLLPPSLADGKSSRGFREVLEVAPLLASDAYGGYWAYLRLCADELAGDAPLLFDPRNPLLALAPTPQALDELVVLFADPLLHRIWLAPDTLGWTYQFFNTQDERYQMREAGAPRNSRELAVRNQFFTPRYVVDFLVQNSLGRRILESDPGSGLIEDMPLLIDPPTVVKQPVPLDELLVLDPACGSGHFLLGAYDLLESAWRRAGVPPADAAARILPCLHGIDIDPRCAQVASAALMLRARRVSRQGSLPRPGVVTARALPRDESAWGRVLEELPAERQRLVAALRDALQQAPVLGSLLKVEGRITAEIQQFVPEAVPDQLWYRSDALGKAEAEVLQVLQRLADEAASSPEERLLAAEAQDAIRFVEALRQRYDVVLMNPPFGEEVPETKAYLRTGYPDAYQDLYASFVARGMELIRSGGYLGALTNRTGFFITTFQRWRDQVIGTRPVVMADLGYGVLEDAIVEVAAYVLSSAGTHRTVFIRLVRDVDKGSGMVRELTQNDRQFVVDPAEFGAIPGGAFAYWTSASIRGLFGNFPSLHSAECSVDAGLQGTKDDSRFVRAWWEVDTNDRGQGRRWVPYAKGGEYSPYLGDVHLVVDWGDDGQRIEAYVLDKYPYLAGNAEWVLHRSDHYFSPGVTWAERTGSASSFWALPAGCVFSSTGPGVIPGEAKDGWALLALLNTRLYEHLLGMLVAAASETSSRTPARHYSVGIVRSLPYPSDASDDYRWRQLVQPLVKARHAELARDETSLHYISPIGEAPDFAAAFNASYEIEQRVARIFSLDQPALEELDRDQGPHPCSYPESQIDPTVVARLCRTKVDKLIDKVVEERGGLRFITVKSFAVDRRIEVLSHILRAHPNSVLEALSEAGIDHWDEPASRALRCLSHLVGVALGRFDARHAIDESAAFVVDPFVALPPDSIAMREADSGPSGRALTSDYPFELPPDGLLVDEPGHQWDVTTAVRRAAETVVARPDEFVAALEEGLGQAVRGYVGKRFFKDHLGMYSKSRRKAPIYWQLSVPSRTWAVWAYAPTLCRETLFAIAREANRRQSAGRERIASLRAERENAGFGRSPRELGARIAEEEDLGAELQVFKIEAERIAALGWEPDLNDGLILCAAPLARLFPMWPAASEERDNLKAGRHQWASVAKWARLL